MKKSILSLLIVAMLSVFVIPQTVFADGHVGNTTVAKFNVRLVPNQETPPVTGVSSSGRIQVRLIDNGNALQFRLTVCNIQNVTMAHIHVGAPGVPGPIVLFLFHMPMGPLPSFQGCHLLSSGILHPSDLIPRPTVGINTWTDFVHALLSGNTYANVHTTAHPAGEIRGQLVLKHTIHHHHEDLEMQGKDD